MKKISIKKIIIVIILLGCFLTYKLPKILINKQIKSIPEVKLKEKIQKEKNFAIMISNDGTNYQQYEGNNIPLNKYYEFNKYECIDNKGNKVDTVLTYNDNSTISLNTNKTIYCTLYFNKKLLGKLKDYDPNNLLSEDLVGDMYRYQGVGVESAVDDTHKLVDNNYICFGTNNVSECKENIEKYMYRIIGITPEGSLKLIKMQGIQEGTSNNISNKFQWTPNASPTACAGSACEWKNVPLYKRLNGISNGTNSSPIGDTDIFVDNERYDYLKSGDVNGGEKESDWYKLIINHNWMYGDVCPLISTDTLNGETVYGAQSNGLILYQIETGKIPTQHYENIDGTIKYAKHQWSAEKSVDAKIGLMYLHDYYLAYDNVKDWYNDFNAYNWIIFVNNQDNTGAYYEWLITRLGMYNTGWYGAWMLQAIGFPNWGGGFGNESLYLVRPVFYISPNINISGTGKIDNPYIIEL